MAVARWGELPHNNYQVLIVANAGIIIVYCRWQTDTLHATTTTTPTLTPTTSRTSPNQANMPNEATATNGNVCSCCATAGLCNLCERQVSENVIMARRVVAFSTY